MGEIVEQAREIKIAASEAVAGVAGLVKNPMLKMIPGADKLPEVVALLSQSAGVLLSLAEEVEKLKGGENGEK